MQQQIGEWFAFARAWGLCLITIALSNVVTWALMIIGGLIVLVALAMGWMYFSMLRGGAKRDKRLYADLDPLAERFEAKEDVPAADVEALARRSQYRPLLYDMLKFYEKLNLFPQEYLSEQAQAEANLCYWMMHPHEMQDPPESIHLLETLDREVAGQAGRYYVFRFRMPEYHWAGEEGWQLGVSGPFFDGDLPHANTATSFARGADTYGEVEPAELVDWFIDMTEEKGILPAAPDEADKKAGQV